MPQMPFTLTPRGPFADLRLTDAKCRPIGVNERDGMGICNLLARKGKRAELASRMRECFGIDLPDGARRTVVDDVALAGIAPQAWLAIRERAGNAFAASLRAGVEGIASVVDQSDGYAVLRLWGPNVIVILGKLAPIDLHAQAFKVGDVATTVSAHIGVTLWRLDDDAQGNRVFEVSMFRSFAASFWHALRESAAEVGGMVE